MKIYIVMVEYIQDREIVFMTGYKTFEDAKNHFNCNKDWKYDGKPIKGYNKEYADNAKVIEYYNDDRNDCRGEIIEVTLE